MKKQSLSLSVAEMEKRLAAQDFSIQLLCQMMRDPEWSKLPWSLSTMKAAIDRIFKDEFDKIQLNLRDGSTGSMDHG